ncbi:hypothetical protein CYY_003486 [Polysphondylium violaceum]|uniref:Carbohydrate binding domain-containing protein n=1 Tax=Polysphondylium violaceum TaxID=133409 RepID=A0A8J4V068_9MYCE|nr:hypothetical protein CYY_003486 [Polysphondylium violaceum]
MKNLLFFVAIILSAACFVEARDVKLLEGSWNRYSLSNDNQSCTAVIPTDITVSSTVNFVDFVNGGYRFQLYLWAEQPLGKVDGWGYLYVNDPLQNFGNFKFEGQLTSNVTMNMYFQPILPPNPPRPSRVWPQFPNVREVWVKAC